MNPSDAKLKGQFAVAALVIAGLLLLCSAAAASTTWALFAFVSAPISLFLYAVLHEQYHAQVKIGALPSQTIGLVCAAALGFSLQIYTRHHRNHHQHGDGEKDYSSTRKKSGQHSPLVIYLLQHALRSFAFQLVPFLYVVMMQKSSRSSFTYIDESTRVGLRVFAMMVGGPSGLLMLLTFQLVAITTIMSLNYFQHVNNDVGRGNTWKNPWFNSLFLNLGYHDRHHIDPAVSWQYLGDSSQ